jgi:hypothetical protein
MRISTSCLFTALLGLVFGGRFLCDIPTLVAAEPQKFELKLRWRVGDKFSLKMATDPEDVAPILRQTNSIGISFEVSKMDTEGKATLIAKLTSLDYLENRRIRISLPEGADSRMMPMISKVMGEVLGKAFTIRVTAVGLVESVDGLDIMLDGVSKNSKVVSRADTVFGENSVHNLKQLFGDKAMKARLQQAFAVFPSRPVGIGDSWDQTLVVDAPVPTIVRSTWTLQSQKDGVFVLAVKSKVDSDPKAGPSVYLATAFLDGGGPQGPISAQFGQQLTTRYDFQGDQEGTVQIDESTGLPIRGKLVQKISGKVTASNGTGLGELAGKAPVSNYSFERTISFERP